MTLKPKVLGIAGWKNSGKTTLTERLIAELTRRGLKVSAVKHAHHSFDVDHPGTDSARHRTAGAREIAIVSTVRYARIRELEDGAEPSLDEIIGSFSPCDLVLVEGYKRLAIAKIEVRREASKSHEPLAGSDENVIAIASESVVPGLGVPWFHLDDITRIADFVVAWMGKP